MEHRGHAPPPNVFDPLSPQNARLRYEANEARWTDFLYFDVIVGDSAAAQAKPAGLILYSLLKSQSL